MYIAGINHRVNFKIAYEPMVYLLRSNNETRAKPRSTTCSALPTIKRLSIEGSLLHRFIISFIDWCVIGIYFQANAKTLI